MTPQVIIFSRDRACQLDALLRSIRRHLRSSGTAPIPTVLWTASTDAFAAGYELCIEREMATVFVRESNFHADLLEILPRSGLVCFFTDDDILHADALLDEAARFLENDQLLAFSLRLGRNTVRCYPHDCDQPLPAPLISDGRTLRWQWASADYDFSYPLSLDGHVMRATDVRLAAQEMLVRNPNELEQVLASRALPMLSWRPRLASYERSVLTGVPANRVNETHPNRCGSDPSRTAAFLNDRYLSGERIDLDALDFSTVSAAHQEIDLKLGSA